MTFLDLLTFTPKGIYCSIAKVYIDPWLPVEKALITHGHADHSRFGHKYYLCTNSAQPVIRHRLGSSVNLHSIPYGESIHINGVKFSFHPAGHIIGSAQIRVEYKGEVWVASGDYKTENDGLSEAFELVKCNAFITESTFGLPIFKWESQTVIAKAINDWWKENSAVGKTSILGGYALGKAQRLLQMLDLSIGKIFTHGAVENINQVIRGQGIPLKETIRVTQKLKRKETIGGMIICPPGSLETSWTRKFVDVEKGVASGWMMQDGTKRKIRFDKGFILSDHADWDGLNRVIKATEAKKVVTTHGYADSFAKWLCAQGLDAQAAKTAFEGEKL